MFLDDIVSVEIAGFGSTESRIYADVCQSPWFHFARLLQMSWKRLIIWKCVFLGANYLFLIGSGAETIIKEETSGVKMQRYVFEGDSVQIICPRFEKNWNENTLK